MDNRLVAWGRAVKARHRRHYHEGRAALPPLWLFTDPARMPDLPTAVAGLPRGLCGVVFRHDGVPDRAALLRRVAQQCRARRLALVVAGGGELPPGAGRHLRGGRGVVPRGVRCTSSAHGVADLVRARRAGVALAFLSPAFVTDSHPGAAALGPLRWGLTAQYGRTPVAALGGIDSRSVRYLPVFIGGIGAIGALLL